MRFSPSFERLVEALRFLPGVGPKSAQRMAMHLLSRKREQGHQLAKSLVDAMNQIHHCERCRLFTENVLCDICSAHHRDESLLCIVENPIDVSALEQTGSYRGKYFVLLGHLSPLDGIGPEQIGIHQLRELFEQGQLRELILATNPTVEGEATAHYISELARPYGMKITRIAHGVPIGSELEYIDTHTLTRALSSRG